ncbi:MAG: MmpS family transport accessory protein [Mycolicibacterium sp.]|uniref:MmpS family transport accessory protein n=1 Tax=Mycolicibacterium sp. TaxID=2320850 RepID=UPI003D145C41
MTDRGRDEQWSSGAGNEPTQQFGYGPSGYSDPAYASQTQYGPPYQPPPSRPTERLPAYSPYGYDPSGAGQFGPQHQPDHDERPGGSKAPRWLWIVTGVAVLTVVGLVIALVVVNSSRQHTVLAPLPSAPEPDFSTPTATPRTPTTTSRTPTTPLLPLPTLPSTSATPPTETSVRGATDSVIYIVEGSGRVINITYVDSGGLLQTEFNVLLPWSKLVSLPQPAEGSASISIINVGRELTCSITVNGIEVEQRTGVGLTICAAPG